MHLYKHQEITADFVIQNKRVFITSDAGTGKTLSVLTGITALKLNEEVSRTLVICPRSIMEPAWGGDIRKWTPWLSYAVSKAGSERNRMHAFDSGCDIVVTNHDAVKWLNEHQEVLEHFDLCVIDESSAFKHRSSQRSRAMRELMKRFDRRILMSATPTSNTITDIWHQAMLLDDGERLGRAFSGFRMQVCQPTQVGPQPNMIEWKDKPGAADIVAERLRDITVRFKFEDCIDIPPNTVRMIQVELPQRLMEQYRELEERARLEYQESEISAIHAGVKAQKLLQLCSGAVYDNDRVARTFDTSRYELVMELVSERPHSVVAFNWSHQRNELIKLAEAQHISWALVDGSVSLTARERIVREYQEGKYQVLFAHPQSAGHGLTLTRGTTTIWASPTYNAEYYQQFNARIYRAGQTQRTETILIAAENTREALVYDVLQGKLELTGSLLSVFADSTYEVDDAAA